MEEQINTEYICLKNNNTQLLLGGVEFFNLTSGYSSYLQASNGTNG